MLDMATLEWEHDLRAIIMKVRQQIEDVSGATYNNVRFENGNDTGTWSINSWGNGVTDTTTKGAVLHDVTNEHIRRLNAGKSISILPALLPAPIKE